jgi:hypothetical protein
MGRINEEVQIYDDPLTADVTFSGKFTSDSLHTDFTQKESLRDFQPLAFSIPQDQPIYERPGVQSDRTIKASILEAVNDPMTRVVAVFEIHEDSRYEEINALVSTGKFTHVLFESPSNDQPLVDEYLSTGVVPYTRRMNAVNMDRTSLDHIREFNVSHGSSIKAVAVDVPYAIQDEWEKELRGSGQRIEDIIKLVADRRDREVVAPAILSIVNDSPEAKVLILRGRGHEPLLMKLLEEGLKVSPQASTDRSEIE